MNHREELKKISPLLHQLHQKGLPHQKIPSDEWFDELHQQTLRELAPQGKRIDWRLTIRIAALLAGAFITALLWNQNDLNKREWEENLIEVQTEELAAYIENDLSISPMDWEETLLDQDLQTELFESLSEEEMEPFLSYALVQMNEIILYNTLNSNL